MPRYSGQEPFLSYTGALAELNEQALATYTSLTYSFGVYVLAFLVRHGVRGANSNQLAHIYGVLFIVQCKAILPYRPNPIGAVVCMIHKIEKVEPA